MEELSKKLFRCAIYTRKSTEHNLDLEFNSLDAQREACEAYIKSQAHEGWRLLPARYDDGAFSGASLDRPALQELLTEVRSGKIGVIVVYKVDRLTRSLADFAKLVELFDRHSVSFVSVTQSFNTTSSMGRLTLNVLLRLPSSSARSSASASATRSPPPSARASGSGDRSPWAMQALTRSSRSCTMKPRQFGSFTDAIWNWARSEPWWRISTAAAFAPDGKRSATEKSAAAFGSVSDPLRMSCATGSISVRSSIVARSSRS